MANHIPSLSGWLIVKSVWIKSKLFILGYNLSELNDFGKFITSSYQWHKTEIFSRTCFRVKIFNIESPSYKFRSSSLLPWNMYETYHMGESKISPTARWILIFIPLIFSNFIKSKFWIWTPIQKQYFHFRETDREKIKNRVLTVIERFKTVLLAINGLRATSICRYINEPNEKN